MKVVVVGGGWAGCAAALTAAKQGARTVLLERTDMLLGTGLVGGIFRNNGRFTAAEEAIALGGGDLFHAMDSQALHTDVRFPGHEHASLYNVGTMEAVVRRLLAAAGVEMVFVARMTEVTMDGDRMLSVTVGRHDEATRYEADVFVDTTGTACVPNACNRHGHGCGMCVLRCHSFGLRVSPTERAGVTELVGHKGDQIGAMSGSCKLLKESLDVSLVRALNRDGMVMVAVPPELKSGDDKMSIKACQQYALPEFEDNLILLDTGHAKLMTPYFPLDQLRRIPGFENARFEDPYAGGIGNSIRYVGMAPRDDHLQVDGVDNLFCAGEKAGLLVGHTEAVVTGLLAGFNAVRQARGEALLRLPVSLSIGDAVTYVREQMQTEAGMGKKFTFSGSVYFERMKDLGLYTTDVQVIRERVAATGLAGVFGGAAGGAELAAQ